MEMFKLKLNEISVNLGTGLFKLIKFSMWEKLLVVNLTAFYAHGMGK